MDIRDRNKNKDEQNKNKGEQNRNKGGAQTKQNVDREAIAGPCKLVKRVKDGAAYILAKDKVYVASTSERVNGAGYLEALQFLAGANR